MILEPGPDALPHMFLKGFRAPPGGTADPNPVAEEVGVFVARQVIGTDGQPRAVEKVLDQDTPFDPPNKPEGPFRFESDLATMKPELDVVIVHDLASILLPAELADPDIADIIVTKPFGNIRIDTGSGFGPVIARNYGWLPRTSMPRLDLAGRAGPDTDPASLEGFDANQFKLPAKYFNAFNAGNPVPGRPPLSPGHSLRFEDGGLNLIDIVVPAGPALAVSQDGEPLDPPLTLTPAVDTVIYDRADASVALVWRAVFQWEARYESATLEVQ
ncbi:MAG: hypothetical protein ACRCS9_15690 [Hyphomicrobium sp.]